MGRVNDTLRVVNYALKPVIRLLFVLLVILWVIKMVAQDAPTVEQCRADAAMWEPQPYSRAFFDALSMAELDHRHTVLLQCGIVGATRHARNMVTLTEAIETDQWNQLDGLYNSHETGRLLSYIKRHGEWADFNKEDAAGQR